MAMFQRRPAWRRNLVPVAQRSPSWREQRTDACDASCLFRYTTILLLLHCLITLLVGPDSYFMTNGLSAGLDEKAMLWADLASSKLAIVRYLKSIGYGYIRIRIRIWLHFPYHFRFHIRPIESDSTRIRIC